MLTTRERQIMLEYRRKKFKVETRKSKYPDAIGEVELSVTHNGYQWQSISLLVEEADRVIASIQKATRPHIDLEREVRKFEEFISRPPFERSTAKFPSGPGADQSTAWPGQYRDIAVQLAWTSWLHAKGLED